MKHYYLSIFLATLMSMAYTMASAHDIAVANSDGKTIYYNYNSDGSSVTVTYQGESYEGYSNRYIGEIVIPETIKYSGNTYSVTSIGSDAFFGCSGLTSVTIPNSVTSISSDAFSGCSSLTSVTIPNSVTSIGTSVFSGCSSLTSVIIGNSVTSIGAWAFMNCSGLTSVVIPNSVTSIGFLAFYGCSSLTSVTIPNSVTSIDNGAFYGTAWYNNQPDGLVYAGNIAYKYKGTMPANTSITLKEGTVGIASYAFSSCSDLTSVTIPNSVTSISDHAFDGCSGLTSVTIPSSVTSIGAWAFKNCSGLTSVTIPNSVTNIDQDVFDGTAWYNNQPDGLVYAGNIAYKYKGTMPANTSIALREGIVGIASSAFYGCSGLTSVTIPNSVTSISDYAFRGCSGLTSVTIPNSVTSIGDYAFCLCSGLTSVTIPNSVTSIGDYAFGGCSGLTSVIIPNSVTSIGSYAFDGCSSLTLMNIPNNMTSIGSYVFSGCSLTSVTIPNSVTSISDHAFDGCSSLTSVIIPNSVTSISAYTFSGCSSLTSVTIPNSVTSISAKAFNGCSGLTSVTIPNSVTSICNRAFQDCSSLTSVIIPNSVTSIEVKTFYNCSSLTSVTIPNSVTSIDQTAFGGCSGLTSVTIPNSVTSIGASAFRGCSGLISVTIPSSVTCIDENAFQGCSNLTSINSEIKNPFILGANAFSDISNQCVLTVPVGKRDAYIAKGWTTDVFQGGIVEETNLYCGYCGDGVIYTYDETTKTLTIEGNNAMADYSDPSRCPWYSYRGDIQTLVIKDGVTSIGDYAFYGCSGLTSVTIPNSVTSIGELAFRDCSRLTSVTIPNSVTSIGYSAFSYCSGLTSVTIPNNVTSIGSAAFYGCSGLTSVTIPNSVTSIGASAFEGCSGLTSVTIPNSVTSIGSGAFKGCSGLEKVIVPNFDIKNWCSIKFDDSSANPLYYAHHLYSDENTEITKLVIPNDVTSIYSYAFYGCSGLTSVTIPNSVTSIGALAFYGTAWSNNQPDGLVYAGNVAYSYRGPMPANTSITLKEGTVGIATYAFRSCNGLTSVTIPNSVTSIGSYAFYRCSGLTSVTIPNSVTNIGEQAFGECNGLTSVTIGNSVTSIGDKAFYGCSGLTSVKVMRKEPPTISSFDTFSSYPIIIYVPYGSKAKYEAAQYWKDFNIRMLSDSNGDDVVNAKDYSGVANYIMGDTPEAFDVEASDVDENGTVDVRDYVGIANIISTGSIYGGTSNNAKAAMSKGMAMPATDESDAENVIYVENVSGSKDSQVELSVRMRNASDIRGFQFDLYLPEGVTIANNAKASLSSDRLAAGDAHTLMVNEMSDGAVRFLCSSMNDENFAGGDGEIATLTVNIADNVANGDYDVVVKNALMTETDISKSYEADNIKSTLTVLDQTGVETVTANDERRDGQIYTVGGQLVGKKSTTSQLRKGIYIRNGRKFVK